MPDPFDGNTAIDAMKKKAKASENPAAPKLPVTEAILHEIDQLLDCTKHSAFVFRTGLRAALALLLRLSEWSFKDKHTITFRCITFFDERHKIMFLSCIEQLNQIYEMEVVFMSGKTTRWGNDVARSIFAMTDKQDSRCIVRDVALLWLLSDRNLDHAVFSWEGGTKGSSRKQVGNLRKQAAMQAGIPQADFSSHSLRIGGLCLLMAHGMDYETAKIFGRWRLDCIKKYWWAATSLAAG